MCVYSQHYIILIQIEIAKSRERFNKKNYEKDSKIHIIGDNNLTLY